MRNWVERILLYLAVLGLAIGVVYLATKIGQPMATASIANLEPRLAAIETAIGSLEKRVDDAFGDVASRVDGSISDHNDQTATALEGINATVANAIKDGKRSLTGLEERIDALFEDLRKRATRSGFACSEKRSWNVCSSRGRGPR